MPGLRRTIILMCLYGLVPIVPAQSLISLAGQGDSTAMLQLAEAYEFGINGFPQNPDSANYWIQKAALTGHREAEYLAGIQQLAKGIKNSDSYAEGVRWLQKSAAQEYVPAWLKLRAVYRDPKSKYYNLKEAHKATLLAANAKNPEATYYSAQDLLKGEGVVRNDSIATKLLLDAAEMGYPAAQLAWAKLLKEGEFKQKPQPFLAAKWYKAVMENRQASLEERTMGDIGLHAVGVMLKKQHNFIGNFLFPGAATQYKIRE